MINEAAINAVKHGRHAVSQADLFEAVEVVLVGKEKKDRIMSQEERRLVSYHEVGPPLVSALQKDYNRTTYDGSTRLCYADSGGREVFEYEERTGSNVSWYACRTCCRRDCI